MGIPHFGASAPYQTLYQQFGLTAHDMANQAERLVREKVA